MENRYEIRTWDRAVALYDTDGTMVAVCAYLKGAVNVARLLNAARGENRPIVRCRENKTERIIQ